MRKRSADYQELFGKIRAILNRYDPAGLNPGTEAPIDEYDAETASIVAYLLHNQEVIKLHPEILVKKLQEIWKEAFDQPVIQEIERLAREMISAAI